MARAKRPSSSAKNVAERNSAAKPAPPLTSRQQAVGIALAGGSLATPLLLALLDKVLTLDEIQAVCARAREIARNYGDLPEGQFALACLEDFLLARTPVTVTPDSQSPALVPSDPQQACPRSDAEDVTAARS
jgi:hypothetical protein